MALPVSVVSARGSHEWDTSAAKDQSRQGSAADEDSAPLIAKQQRSGKVQAVDGFEAAPMSQHCKAMLYGLLNISSTVAIVMANKLVMSKFAFKFPVALTWCHSIFTAVGMQLMCAGGMFEQKTVPLHKVVPVAAVYVGFIVFNNLSLKFNTIGFYQITKIAITPVVIAIEAICYGKYPTRQAVGATVILLCGVALATVTDQQVSSNTWGVIIGLSATLMSAMYQIWASTKQKELGLNGNQLLHQSSPAAVALLTVLIPAMEPLGLQPGPDGSAPAGTLLGFSYSIPSIVAIFVSSVLGLLVTLSAFLVIGATSPLTYNVVGHLKTVLIVGGGVLLFGDSISLTKFLGLCVAMAGILWYTSLQASGATSATATVTAAGANGSGRTSGSGSGAAGAADDSSRKGGAPVKGLVGAGPVVVVTASESPDADASRGAAGGRGASKQT